MIEALKLSFVQNALAAGIISSVLLAVIGVYVVLKKMSFIGDGIAHSAFGGVALGLLLGYDTTLSAVIFAWLTAMLIGVSRRKGKTSEDALIGIFFAFTMALGVIFIGFNKNYTADIFGYLFGDILAVTGSDVAIIGAVAAVVLLCVFLFGKELLFFIYDEDGAKVSGVKTDFIYFLLLTLITLSVVASIKIIGIILVVAFLIIPASAALLLAKKFNTVVAIAVIIGVVSTITGFILSYVFDLASGATIVVTATALFSAAAVWDRLKK